MHDAYAAQAARGALVQESGDRDRRLVPVQAVQVDAVLDRPVAAPQLSQNLALEPGAQVGLLADIERIVDR